MTATKKTSLAAKMVAIMGEIERIPERGRNQHSSYNFATAEDVSDHIRALMAKHKVAFFPSMVDCDPYETETKNGKSMHGVRIKWEMTFVCADSGDEKTIGWYSEGLDTGDKAMGKAATVGCKFALLKAFVVWRGEPDPDAETPERGASNNAPSSKVKKITKAQLKKMETAVKATGRTWDGFVEWFAGQNEGQTPENLPREAADAWIKKLESWANSNGDSGDDASRVAGKLDNAGGQA